MERDRDFIAALEYQSQRLIVCPVCKADPGKECQSARNQNLAKPHRERLSRYLERSVKAVESDHPQYLYTFKAGMSPFHKTGSGSSVGMLLSYVFSNERPALQLILTDEGFKNFRATLLTDGIELSDITRVKQVYCETEMVD